MIGNHSFSRNRKVLKPEGKFVIIGGAKGNWLAPLMSPIKAIRYSEEGHARGKIIIAVD